MMKATRIATISLCMLLLVLPSLAIPVFQSTDSGAENRYLADYPVLVDEEDGLNPDFDADFEAWLCDHFALRAQAVRLNAWINYRLLRTSPSDQVIIGAGDWLYYADTAPDYTGEGRLTEAELAGIVQNLRALAEALDGRGARLYVAIVPNKSTIYPQYMPARYRMRGDGGNIPLLREACEGLPLTWIDLTGPFAQAAERDELIYCRTDTHWNALGAAIAAQTALRAMGREPVGFETDGKTEFSEGDLARLMGLPGGLREAVPNVVPARALPEADWSEHRVAANGGGEGRLVMYRDSFGTAIAPWLVQAYGSADLRWEFPLDGARPCDDALLMICERNLRLYLTDPPYLDDDEEGEYDDPEPLPGEDDGFEDIDIDALDGDLWEMLTGEEGDQTWQGDGPDDDEDEPMPDDADEGDAENPDDFESLEGFDDFGDLEGTDGFESLEGFDGDGFEDWDDETSDESAGGTDDGI